MGAPDTTPAARVGSWPLAQTDAGVMSDGLELLHALELIPNVTKAIKCRPIVQNRRVTTPGFYQFLLKSVFQEKIMVKWRL